MTNTIKHIENKRFWCPIFRVKAPRSVDKFGCNPLFSSSLYSVKVSNGIFEQNFLRKNYIVKVHLAVKNCVQSTLSNCFLSVVTEYQSQSLLPVKTNISYPYIEASFLYTIVPIIIKGKGKRSSL